MWLSAEQSWSCQGKRHNTSDNNQDDGINHGTFCIVHIYQYRSHSSVSPSTSSSFPSKSFFRASRLPLCMRLFEPTLCQIYAAFSAMSETRGVEQLRRGCEHCGEMNAYSGLSKDKHQSSRWHDITVHQIGVSPNDGIMPSKGIQIERYEGRKKQTYT